jgi:hypothetical protein
VRVRAPDRPIVYKDCLRATQEGEEGDPRGEPEDEDPGH